MACPLCLPRENGASGTGVALLPTRVAFLRGPGILSGHAQKRRDVWAKQGPVWLSSPGSFGKPRCLPLWGFLSPACQSPVLVNVEEESKDCGHKERAEEDSQNVPCRKRSLMNPPMGGKASPGGGGRSNWCLKHFQIAAPGTINAGNSQVATSSSPARWLTAQPLPSCVQALEAGDRTGGAPNAVGVAITLAVGREG